VSQAGLDDLHVGPGRDEQRHRGVTQCEHGARSPRTGGGASAATALLAVAATASPATAAKPEPITTPEFVELGEFCGSSITLTFVENNVKRSLVEGESGFTERLRGNFVIELTTDDGRSAVLRTPGQLRIIGAGDSVTVSSIGRTFLALPPLSIPELEAQRDAQIEAGLPDLALITGRVDTAITLDPETGMEIDAEITYSGRVIDVCELLE
jgi:hypothetical protein